MQKNPNQAEFARISAREEQRCEAKLRKPIDTSSDPEFGPWLAQASVLVIDDEPGMRNFLVRTLGPRCKRIEEASNTEEASAKMDASYFDVVILDNVMPGKNGVDWLAEQPNSVRSAFLPTPF
jgi:PleD family two-component response regulator